MRISTIVLAALMALFMMSVAGTAIAQPTQVPPGPPEGLPPEDGTPPENPGPPTGVGTPIVSLSGSAFYIFGPLTIDARVLPNGRVQGTHTWVDSRGSLITGGPVLEVVPPPSEVDSWGISARRTDP